MRSSSGRSTRSRWSVDRPQSRQSAIREAFEEASHTDSIPQLEHCALWAEVAERAVQEWEAREQRKNDEELARLLREEEEIERRYARGDGD